MNYFRSVSGAAVILLMFITTLQAAPQPAPQPAHNRKKPVLTFGAGMRFRYEFQNNFNQKFYGDEPGQGKANDGFLLGRFRAGLDWYPTDTIHIALWGQYSDAWDMEMPDSAYYKSAFLTDHNPNKDRWEFYTTYLELTNLFDLPLALKAGRQIIAYGNFRVFGPGEWGNTGRWIWDAVKLSWRFERGFVDLFYGQTMLHEARGLSIKHRHGFAGLGAYAHVDLVRTPFLLAFEPMLFTKYDRHNNYYGEKKGFYRLSDGTRVTYKKRGDIDSWYAGARVYVQDMYGFDLDFTFLQEQGDFARDDLRAYGYHAMVAYTIKAKWEPRISFEYSYASGDSNPDDGDHETFQGAFGARDKMYGRMNLFHWRNLRDLEAGLTLKPVRGLSMKLSFHKFLLAERRDAWYLNQNAYRDTTGRSGDDIGREFDAVVKYRLRPDHTLMAGYGHFWPDEFAEKNATGKQANWFFLQWEYTFSMSMVSR